MIPVCALFRFDPLMKNILGLLIVIGLFAVAWVNREKLSATLLRPPPVAETTPEPEPVAPEPPPMKFATPTLHPAAEALLKAKQLYPGIAIPNSALNRKFIGLYNEAQLNNPSLLTHPDWPIELAEHAVVALGGAPQPRTTPAPITPKPLPGTAMDRPHK
jgi:hypothetical protein